MSEEITEIPAGIYKHGIKCYDVYGIAVAFGNQEDPEYNPDPIVVMSEYREGSPLVYTGKKSFDHNFEFISPPKSAWLKILITQSPKAPVQESTGACYVNIYPKKWFSVKIVRLWSSIKLSKKLAQL